MSFEVEIGSAWGAYLKKIGENGEKPSKLCGLECEKEWANVVKLLNQAKAAVEKNREEKRSMKTEDIKIGDYGSFRRRWVHSRLPEIPVRTAEAWKKFDQSPEGRERQQKYVELLGEFDRLMWPVVLQAAQELRTHEDRFQ